MARLIDANKAVKAVYDFCDNEIGDSPDNYLIKGSDVLKLIESIPTVDAQPVVHGEWINVRRFHDDCYKADCSNCLETTIMDWGIPRADYKHCRFCGAKMN